MAISTFSVAGLLLLAFYILRKVFSTSKKNPLPPGPKPIPIIGNIADLPARNSQEWRHWLKYKERYGDIFSITVMGQTLVIVHDKNAVFQLMEKRATNYSDRPWLEFGMGMYEHCAPIDHANRTLIAIGAGLKKDCPVSHTGINCEGIANISIHK
jgi:hypothetical protein